MKELRKAEQIIGRSVIKDALDDEDIAEKDGLSLVKHISYI